MNLNKAILIGNLTRDPEIKTTPSGQQVASFGIATNRTWNDQSGQKQTAVEFHNIVAWRRLAEICAQYLKKGSLVMIEGRIQTRSWQGQDGTTKYRTEIVAENMQMGPRGGQTGNFTPSPASKTTVNKPVEENVPSINLDELGNPIEDGEPGEPPSEIMPF